MCSVWCFPNHCVVGGERGWLGCIWVWSSSCILVTQMVKFLWIFEIINFYEINNFVSIRVSFYIVSLCKTSYLNISFINCFFIHSFNNCTIFWFFPSSVAETHFHNPSSYNKIYSIRIRYPRILKCKIRIRIRIREYWKSHIRYTSNVDLNFFKELSNMTFDLL